MSNNYLGFKFLVITAVLFSICTIFTCEAKREFPPIKTSSGRVYVHSAVDPTPDAFTKQRGKRYDPDEFIAWPQFVYMK